MKTQLIFENVNELERYINEHNISFDNLQIFEINKQNIETISESNEEKIILPETTKIQLISLYDNPTIEAKVSENNILYVEDMKINPDSCMPAIIDILDRKVSVVLCNENGKTHANLNIALDNNPRYNVVFEVRKLDGENFTMEIDKSLLIEKKLNDS